MKTWSMLLVGLAVVGFTFQVRAESDLEKQVQEMAREINRLKMEKGNSGPAGSSVLGRISEKDRGYGPDAVVTSKAGRVTIGGLLQVWYYAIEQDTYGLFGNATEYKTGKAVVAPLNPGMNDMNDGKSYNSFRIRRAEIKLTADVHENVQAVVMFDPARENTSNPAFPSNLGLAYRMCSQDNSNVANNYTAGSAATNRMLQDAYIKVHKLVQYHTFQLGQFKPAIGLEGIKAASALDFPERSMVGQLFDYRDLGAQITGEFVDSRVVYNLGVFDTAANFVTGGSQQNRADTNDDKDLLASLIVRPLWNDEKWGSMELGLGMTMGKHGDEVGNNIVSSNMDTRENTAWRRNVYFTWKPGGDVAGLWMATEWTWIKDRFTGVGAVMLDSMGVARLTGSTLSATSATMAVDPYTTDGWYGAIGYKLSGNKNVSGWAKNLEFLYRYETYENILIQDRDNAKKVAAGTAKKYEVEGISTNIHTLGINYYISGNNAKIQAAYNLVGEDTPSKKKYGMREVKNNNFTLAFQVAF